MVLYQFIKYFNIYTTSPNLNLRIIGSFVFNVFNNEHI